MQRNKIMLASVALMVVLVSGAYTRWHLTPVRAAAAAYAPAGQVIYLDQGWSKADRDTFYWISQGTVMMSYDIYQNLELADNQDLFRSDSTDLWQHFDGVLRSFLPNLLPNWPSSSA